LTALTTPISLSILLVVEITPYLPHHDVDLSSSMTVNPLRAFSDVSSAG
jgi:hypothetical protein